MVKDKTLYNILKVDPSSTESQIKRSYYELSKIHHPDKNPGKEIESEEKFKEISKAKDILLDEKKRSLYDKIGMDIFKNNNEHNDGGNHFSDFSSMFGGMGGFPFGGGNMKKQVENIIHPIKVTLEQLYKEENINLNYKFNSMCDSCDGEGSIGNIQKNCDNCNGKGIFVQLVNLGPMKQMIQRPCDNCNGKGKIVPEEHRCKTCNKKGFVEKDKSINITLKSGFKHGNQIQFQGQGHQLKEGMSNLIVVINEIKHKVFKRIDNDLFITIDLKLYQSLFGFEKSIIHLDGRKLYINCSTKTDFNTIRKIQGDGFRDLNINIKGDLYIKFNIILPNIGGVENYVKKVIQSFDDDEVINENKLKENKLKENKSSCNLINLNKQDINKLNYFLLGTEVNGEKSSEKSSENINESASCNQQ
jgi:DnaJ family protein A protein 2